MSITVRDIGAEIPDAWIDAINKRINDLNHDDLCGCQAWPDACKYYTAGQWDGGTDVYIAAVVVRDLVQQAADTYHRALDQLVTHIHEACNFDAGETCPEDAPWAAALDRLDTAMNELIDGLIAKGLWH